MSVETSVTSDTAANEPFTLDHDAIARLIPHSGSMCLLASMTRWSDTEIICSATSHRDPRNPLRTARGLSSPCAIEYAAQAMALHGALVGRATASASAVRPGYLASARGVQLHLLRIDELIGDLRIEVTRLAGDDKQILYSFNVTHQGDPVADGRAAVVLNTPLATPTKPILRHA